MQNHSRSMQREVIMRARYFFRRAFALQNGHGLHCKYVEEDWLWLLQQPEGPLMASLLQILAPLGPYAKDLETKKYPIKIHNKVC